MWAIGKWGLNSCDYLAISKGIGRYIKWTDICFSSLQFMDSYVSAFGYLILHTQIFSQSVSYFYYYVHITSCV